MPKPITSQDIKERFLQILSENTLEYFDELQIFEAISKKYNFKTVSDYARDNKISYNGVLDGIKREKIPNIKIGNVSFCFM